MADKKLILTIDGGGVRGIIPALILRELEEKLSRSSGNWRSIESSKFSVQVGEDRSELPRFKLVPN
ncbi:hypothetical protein SG09_14930 [Bradyrhizobium ottawaense]|nr:hypothetical protein [Bradyrhizobium ottawaense]BBO02143.1 hypothetical protein SG09_14930 [Bradyrhizobium ottawaense]